MVLPPLFCPKARGNAKSKGGRKPVHLDPCFLQAAALPREKRLGGKAQPKGKPLAETRGFAHPEDFRVRVQQANQKGSLLAAEQQVYRRI